MKHDLKGASRTKAVQDGRRKAVSVRKVALEPSYRTAKTTQEAILAAAEAVLLRHGHSGFTLKRVADQARISVGNLNYHFPTKDLLLTRMVDLTLAEFQQRFDGQSATSGKPSAERLGELMEWFMEDSTQKRYTHLFRELWAAALHSRSLDRALQSFYDRSIAQVINLADGFDGRRERRRLEAIVYLMCVLSEGATVVFGTRARPSPLFTDVKELARAAINHLVAQRP